MINSRKELKKYLAIEAAKLNIHHFWLQWLSGSEFACIYNYMWVLRHLEYFMSKSQSSKIFTPPPFDISVMAQETSNKIWHTSWTRCCCRRFSHSSPGIFTLLWYSANRKELYGSPNGTFWQETSWHWRRPTNHGRG